MTPPAELLTTAAEAAGTAAVLMVSWFVSGPEAVKVAVGSAKLQEKYAGSVPQEKVTVP